MSKLLYEAYVKPHLWKGVLTAVLGLAFFPIFMIWFAQCGTGYTFGVCETLPLLSAFYTPGLLLANLLGSHLVVIVISLLLWAYLVISTVGFFWLLYKSNRRESQ